MTHVVEINHLHDLTRFQLAWKALWHETQRAHIFQSYEHLTKSWHRLGQGAKWRVLLVYSSGKMIGILPLIATSRRLAGCTARVVGYPGPQWVRQVGPIGPNPTATLHTAIKFLASQRRSWDVLDFQCSEHDRSQTKLAMDLAGLAGRLEPSQPIAVVDLREGWQTSRSRARNEFRRLEVAAARRGRLQLERHRPAGMASGKVELCWDLLQQCSQHPLWKWRAAAHIQPAIDSGDAHEVASSLGAIDLNLLRLDGQPIAAAYHYQRQGTLIQLWSGHDTRYAELYPSTLLMARLLEDSHRRGDTQLILSPDDTDGHRHWATRWLPTARGCCYGRSPAAQLLRLARCRRRQRAL